MTEFLFENPTTNQRKVVKMGFAWDVLLLNGLLAYPMMRRRIWSSVAGWWIVMAGMYLVFPVGLIGAWACSGVVDAFSANKEYAQRLSKAGYRLAGSNTANEIAKVKWKLEEPVQSLEIAANS